jgi:hypothetical protein
MAYPQLRSAEIKVDAHRAKVIQEMKAEPLCNVVNMASRFSPVFAQKTCHSTDHRFAFVSEPGVRLPSFEDHVFPSKNMRPCATNSSGN